MRNCHVLDMEDIVIGLTLGCEMMLSKISAPLVYSEIWGMDGSLLRVPQVVRLIDGEKVLTAAYFGEWYVIRRVNDTALTQFLS